MVNIEFTAGASTFKINNITLVRNFHSYVHGNKLRIVSAYDTRYELLPYTLFSDISVNGVVYGSIVELAENLSPILFLKRGGSDTGGVTTLSGNIITKVIPVEIDWTQDSVLQIVNYVNSREFVVLGTQRILFKGARIIGDVETSNAVEFYYWEFKPGKGNYGVNGTNISGTDIEYISFVTNYQNNVIDLGEIGSTPIEVFINDTGPYAINSASLNVFKTLRQGTPANYIYVGQSNSIGLGETQTIAEDYIDVNATPVNPPSSTGGLDVPLEDGLVPVSRSDGSLVWEPKSSSSSTEVTTFTSGWQSGFTYKPFASWVHNGVPNSDTREFTLVPPSTAGYFRIDVMVINLSTAQIEIMEGVASDNPVKPDIDPSLYLEGPFILLEAGTTQPAGNNFDPIFDEHLREPDEWDIFHSAFVDPDSINDSFSGTKSIEVTNASGTGSHFYFQKDGGVLVENFTQLSFKIKNKQATLGDIRIEAQGKKSNGKNYGHRIVSNLSDFGYDKNNVTDWQTISIPMSIPGAATVEKIHFYNSFSNSEEKLNFFIDDIRQVTTEEENMSGDFATVEYVDLKAEETLQAAKDHSNSTSLIPVTDEFFFSTGDSQTMSLSYTPADGKVRIFINGNRIYSTQYNLLNEQQVKILDTLTDGDPIAIDYPRLASEIITLLLLTPQGGIEKWSVDRNSTATYEDSSGVIQTAAVNTARIDYSTGVARILMEGQRTNLCLYSNDFTQSVWVKNESTITADVGTAPDGSGTASRWLSDSAATSHYLGQVVAADAGVDYTISCWVKSNTGVDQDFKLFFENGIFVSLPTVVATTNWKRFYFKINASGSTTYKHGISRPGDNSASDLLVWGFQMEKSSAVTSYIPTTSAAVTRLADVITIAPPTGTTEITEVIDGTTTKVTTIPATYQIPQGNVSKIEMK